MKKRRLIEVSASLVLVAALVYVADLEQTYSTIASVDISYYLGAAAVYLLTYIPSSRRWQIISGSIDHNISLTDAFRVIAVSYSFNKLLPWNFGDMVRSKISESYHEVETHGGVLGGAGLERVLDAVTITSVIGVSAVFTSMGSELGLSIVLFAAVFVLGGAFLLSEKSVILVRYAPSKIESFVEETIAGFQAVSREDLVEILTMSQLKWWLEAATFYLLAVSIVPTFGFWDAAIVTSVISVFAAFPISPAGIGPGDAAATGLLVYAGMDYSAALSLVLLQRSIGVALQGAVGALIYGLDL